MKRIVTLLSLALCLINSAFCAKEPKGFYQIMIYHFQNGEQEKQLDDYLSKSYLPALHRQGIKDLGVFKAIENDTIADKKLYLLVPYKSLSEFNQLAGKLAKDDAYTTAAAGFLNSAADKPPYRRVENILLRNFDPEMQLHLPHLSGPSNDRVYELRSYESPSVKLHLNKLNMFIEGGETKIFDEINANPIFYGSVIAGSNMPNLMYMTSFENKAERDLKWKAFNNHPQWQKLKAMDFYKKNVSKVQIMFLKRAEYSDL